MVSFTLEVGERGKIFLGGIFILRFRGGEGVGWRKVEVVGGEGVLGVKVLRRKKFGLVW